MTCHPCPRGVERPEIVEMRGTRQFSIKNKAWNFSEQGKFTSVRRKCASDWLWQLDSVNWSCWPWPLRNRTSWPEEFILSLSEVTRAGLNHRRKTWNPISKEFCIKSCCGQSYAPHFNNLWLLHSPTVAISAQPPVISIGWILLFAKSARVWPQTA